jgi:cytochrome c-type biogenesis protein CcmH/NrfF
VDYYRSIFGEHPDWAEYREAMIKQGKSLLGGRPVLDSVATAPVTRNKSKTSYHSIAEVLNCPVCTG